MVMSAAMLPQHFFVSDCFRFSLAVNNNFAAMKSGHVSSNFAEAKHGHVSNQINAAKNGQVSCKSAAAKNCRVSSDVAPANICFRLFSFHSECEQQFCCSEKRSY